MIGGNAEHARESRPLVVGRSIKAVLHPPLLPSWEIGFELNVNLALARGGTKQSPLTLQFGSCGAQLRWRVAFRHAN